MLSREKRHKIYEEEGISKDEMSELNSFARNFEVPLETAVKLYRHYDGDLDRALATFESLKSRALMEGYEPKKERVLETMLKIDPNVLFNSDSV